MDTGLISLFDLDESLCVQLRIHVISADEILNTTSPPWKLILLQNLFRAVLLQVPFEFEILTGLLSFCANPTFGACSIVGPLTLARLLLRLLVVLPTLQQTI